MRHCENSTLKVFEFWRQNSNMSKNWVKGKKFFFVILVRISNMIKSWRFFLPMWDVMCVKMATTRKMQKKLKSVRKENWELKWGVKWIFKNQHPTNHTYYYSCGVMIWFFARLNANFPFIVSSSLWGGRLVLKILGGQKHFLLISTLTTCHSHAMVFSTPKPFLARIFLRTKNG